MALPNTLTNIMPKILARGLMTLRERAVMPRLVNMDYSNDAAQKGSTIDVPIPTAIAAAEVSPSHAHSAVAALTPSSVAIPLNKWYQSTAFGLTDKELVELDENRHFVPMQVDEAVRGLANQVNSDCMAEYTGIYNAITQADSGGSTIFANVDQITGARRAMNETNCPRDNRRLVTNFVGEDALLQLSGVTAFNEVGGAGGQPRVSGEVGSRYGFDIYADDAAPFHDTTVAGSVLVDNGAGYAAGIKTMHVDAMTATAVVGDVFSMDHAGSIGVKNYVVKSIANYDASGDEGDITFEPGLKAAVVNDQALTFKGDHTNTLAFHRDAFALATRPLMSETGQYDGMNSNMMSMTDPLTGLSLRLEVSRQHKQVVWEFDILYGVKLVRPELACRILDV